MVILVDFSKHFKYFLHCIKYKYHLLLDGLMVFQESSEAKRKVGKRNTKSEKELLGFTLKYQKVIAERDAG